MYSKVGRDLSVSTVRGDRAIRIKKILSVLLAVFSGVVGGLFLHSLSRHQNERLPLRTFYGDTVASGESIDIEAVASLPQIYRSPSRETVVLSGLEAQDILWILGGAQEGGVICLDPMPTGTFRAKVAPRESDGLPNPHAYLRALEAFSLDGKSHVMKRESIELICPDPSSVSLEELRDSEFRWSYDEVICSRYGEDITSARSAITICGNMREICLVLTLLFSRPVVDRSSLFGRYKLTLKWRERQGGLKEALARRGFVLSPVYQELETLVLQGAIRDNDFRSSP